MHDFKRWLYHDKGIFITNTELCFLSEQQLNKYHSRRRFKTPERYSSFTVIYNIDSDSDSDNVYSTKIDTDTISGLQKT